MLRICAISCALLAATPALSADYVRNESNKAYELSLSVPAPAMAIAPLKADILARWNTMAGNLKQEAIEDRKDDPQSTNGFSLDCHWRVTFENPAVLSLSNEIYIDEGGAHPNGDFDTIVWDKEAGRAVPITALFAPGQAKPALKAIADAATKAWNRAYQQRSGQAPGPDADMASQGIAPDKLEHYALTYAKGQTNANGIVLLYGAGAVWPHVIGEFRLSVPAPVFAAYLTPQWKAVFGVR